MLNKLRSRIREAKGRKNEFIEWESRGFLAPSPSNIKRAVLLRHGTPQTVWVETGTFKGDTTALLAQKCKQIHTIEPEPLLYAEAKNRFAGQDKVNVIHGLSENVFPQLLPTLSGDLNFWLDGHYSGGITHQGPIDCPVREELRHIQDNRHHFRRLTVLIDDIRCFDPTIPAYSDYPPLDELVDWARINRLKWHIEHDIFIAQSIPS
jgi:hypothetical protein